VRYQNFYITFTLRGDSGISWTICRLFVPRSRQITTPAPHHSIYYRLDALPAAEPTVSKHWRQFTGMHTSIITFIEPTSLFLSVVYTYICLCLMVYLFVPVCSMSTVYYCVTFASQKVSLIVIPFCLSVCRSFRDLQPTTIDRSQPNLVSRYIPDFRPV